MTGSLEERLQERNCVSFDVEASSDRRLFSKLEQLILIVF